MRRTLMIDRIDEINTELAGIDRDSDKAVMLIGERADLEIKLGLLDEFREDVLDFDPVVLALLGTFFGHLHPMVNSYDLDLLIELSQHFELEYKMIDWHEKPTSEFQNAIADFYNAHKPKSWHPIAI